MRLAIVFVLTALGVAIYLADAKPLTVDTNVAINIQNPPRAKAKPMTQRAAARVKPDQKGDEDDLCQNKQCGEVCDTSAGALAVIRNCQKDGSCKPGLDPDCPDKNVTNPNWYESPRCNIKPISNKGCKKGFEWTRYWYKQANGTHECEETFGSSCSQEELLPAFPTYEECLHTCVYHEVPQPNELDPTPKESCKIELKPNDGCLCQMADQWSRYWYNSTKRECEVAYGSSCCNMSVYKAFPTYAECITTCKTL